MYKIKRFSKYKEIRLFAARSLSELKDQMANYEQSISGHIMSFMGIESWQDNNVHWSKELTTFVSNATKGYTRDNINKGKLKHVNLFPTFLVNSSTDFQKENVVKERMNKENRRNLIKFASSDLFVTILTEFCDKCDEYVKEMKRTIEVTSSDKEFISDTLHSIRENHYDDLSSWRK